jgi:hypothetical protein
MRRHSLDPDRYRALVRRILLRRGVLLASFYLLFLGLLERASFVSAYTWPIGGVAFVATVVMTWLRTRPAMARQLASFDVVVSPRVVRRVMPLLPVAEVLRPEVTRIVETARGLWLVSEHPRRTVSLSSVLAGYAELRAALAAWGPIEPLRGLPAFAFAFGQLRHMRPRDRLDGALAGDATLVDELATVRALSADHGAGYGPTVSTRGRLLRVLIVWALLIVMFLAIWQFLSPAGVR